MIAAYCAQKNCPIGDQKDVKYCWKKTARTYVSVFAGQSVFGKIKELVLTHK